MAVNDVAVIGAALTIILALIGVVWSNLRGDISELKARVTASEKQDAALVTEHARSEERDKVFEKGIERLTKAIDDFDSRIGTQIERLSRIVEQGIRRYSPPSGTPKAKTSYKFLPNDDEEK